MSTSIKVISIFAGLFVGLLVTAQFRTTTPLSSSYPLDELEAQKDLIKTYSDEETSLKSRIVSLRGKIDENLEQNQNVSQTTNLEALNELKKTIGLAELSGPGFTIELNDSPFIDRNNLATDEGGIVYAADIRDVVNLLRAQNVDGIAINDQRVIATSSISSVGNTLLINNSHITPPFLISVIGDYDSMLLRLKDQGVLSDLQKRVKENGIQFTLKKSPRIVLPIYNGQFRLKYLSANEAS